jgi:GTP-binding protein HflX
MAQQEGYVGARGPGESGKESLRRYYEEKIRQAKKRLATLAKSREVQRKQRLRRGIDLICLVGYTNAGKSTLLNLLTKSDVLAEDKLFATLDTTTRELFLPPDKKVLLSDTVGFISQLPHNLIEAFKSTLDELRYARLLVHVIDCSHPAWQEQVEVVQKTLKDLDIKAPMINVFNKVDRLDEEERAALDEVVPHYQPAVLTHAQDKDGAEALLSYLQKSV